MISTRCIGAVVAFSAGLVHRSTRYRSWLYARFTLSFRDGEEMLAERGLDVSYGA